MKMLRGKGREEFQEKQAPERWREFPAYKNVQNALEKSYSIDLDKYYNTVSQARKQRPALDALTVRDTLLTVSNRGLADQTIRSRIIELKMRVLRNMETLKATVSLFKKTVLYEDSAWLKRHYTATDSKNIAESACLEALQEIAELEVFINYVDVLIDDIDKAGRVHQNGMYAISRETLPEKFGHR